MPYFFASLMLIQKVHVGKTTVVLLVVDQVISLSVPLIASFEGVYRLERGKRAC